MGYKLYKMLFDTSHFGKGTLESAELTFTASRLFSALSIEALQHSKYNELIDLAMSDEFVLSDAFPYKYSPFLPKPIGYPKLDSSSNENDFIDVVEVRTNAKKQKKLEYIQFEEFEDYLDGEIFENRHFADLVYITKNNPIEDAGLYQVGIKNYIPEVSLYFIANESKLLTSLMESLQYTGIGGKRSSGYGQFKLSIDSLPESLENKLTLNHTGNVMTLTTSLPENSELSNILEDSHYLLTKSSGFAFSTTFNTNLRKQDLYKFKAGSTFKKTFKGQIVDTRPIGFEHEVLNYAKPLFYKLERND